MRRWDICTRIKEAIQAFRKALCNASGVRRLVLVRCIAEAEVYDGEGERALQTIQAEKAALSTGPQGAVPEQLARLFDDLHTDPLSRWEVMDEQVAASALDLTLGSVLTNLGKVEDARLVLQKFENGLDGFLMDLPGQCFLLRWGRAWTYLLSELIGHNRSAEAVCYRLYQYPELRTSQLEEEWATFLSSEGMVAYRLGHYARAQAIADERLRFALLKGNLRDQTQIWNTKGILAHYLADLNASAESYLRARDISHVIGNRRGEVIALHNLAGVYLDLGKLDLAEDYERQYLVMSRMSGNHLAEAYAPITLATIMVEKGKYVEAEELLNQALHTAAQNGWPSLVITTQIFLSYVYLHCWMETRNMPILTRAVRLLHESEQANPEDFDAESYAYLVLVLYFAGEIELARAAMKRFASLQDESWVSDRWWLELAERILAGQPLQPVQEQFEQHEFRRFASFIERVRRVIENEKGVSEK